MVRSREKEREEMLKKFVDYKNRIWGDEAHACNILSYDVSQGVFYADCESTMTTLRLTEKNYERVLNDMFYDYCVENAHWMGVS